MLPVGATVELEVETQDSFNRIVATVWLVANGNRTNLNEAMLRDGHAWAYRRYMKNPRFCDIEQEARARKAGLWAQPVSDWVYPPEWRYLKDGEIRVLPTPYEETRETCLAVLGLAGKGTYTPPEIDGDIPICPVRKIGMSPFTPDIFLADSTSPRVPPRWAEVARHALSERRGAHPPAPASA